MRELAQAFLVQGKTVRAAALMLMLIETEPTPENLKLVADIYIQQGLFDDAKELYLQVVKSEMKPNARGAVSERN
jgi:pentatricopeptide repeat protein